MSSFEPRPLQVISDPAQLKALADPLRIRVLNILRQRAATNQQIADALGEPHAKVLYHIRFLLESGLIQLVDQRIKGGNVEKYYRAVARLFSVRPDPGTDAAELAATVFDVVQQEVAASEITWPDQWMPWETREVRLPPERAKEFYVRLLALIAEYWGGPVNMETAPDQVPVAEEDPNAPLLSFAAVIYRDPADSGSTEY